MDMHLQEHVKQRVSAILSHPEDSATPSRIMMELTRYWLTLKAEAERDTFAMLLIAEIGFSKGLAQTREQARLAAERNR